jgi:GntR family transcriptional regulator
MNSTWSDDQPIYRQLRDRVVAMILEAAIAEGEALPSVRTVSAEYRINHLTVLKAYQELSDEGIVENRRGVGLFVNPGARERLLRSERRLFLKEEWPRIRLVIQRLGLKPEELLRSRTSAARPKARVR